MNKTQEKQSHFINLGEETIEKSPTQPSIQSSPPHDESPFRPERENNPPPPPDFEPSPRKTPEVDPNQQEAYNYPESLE